MLEHWSAVVMFVQMMLQQVIVQARAVPLKDQQWLSVMLMCLVMLANDFVAEQMVLLLL